MNDYCLSHFVLLTKSTKNATGVPVAGGMMADNNKRATGAERTRGRKVSKILNTFGSVGALREGKSLAAIGSGSANSGNVNWCFQH
jgi:hypothetical protein